MIQRLWQLGAGPTCGLGQRPGKTLGQTDTPRREMDTVDTDILELPQPPADTRVHYGPEPLQFGDLRLPKGKGPFPVVLAVHGGFWRAEYSLDHLGHACAAWAHGGFAVWSLEYRRVGHPGGGFPGTLTDVALGADYLRTLAKRYPLDLSRVVAVGHSAGGHLALWLGARHRLAAGSPLASPTPLPLRGIVPLAAVSDLKKAAEMGLGRGIVSTFMGGLPAQRARDYAVASPAELLPLGGAQHLVHGEDDTVVPISLSRGYVVRAKARGDSVELTALPHTGHFELIDPRTKQWTSVMSAVEASARTTR